MSSIDNALLIDRYALRAQPHAVLAASVADGVAEIAGLNARLNTALAELSAQRENSAYWAGKATEEAGENKPLRDNLAVAKGLLAEMFKYDWQLTTAAANCAWDASLVTKILAALEATK